jgi:hypothetical protein
MATGGAGFGPLHPCAFAFVLGEGEIARASPNQMASHRPRQARLEDRPTGTHRTKARGLVAAGAAGAAADPKGPIFLGEVLRHGG